VTATKAARLPLWTSRRQLLRVALGLAVAILVAAALFVEFERRSQLDEMLSRIELYSRILDQQAGAILGSSDVALRSIDYTLDELPPLDLPAADSARISALLSNAFRGNPVVRSTSVLTKSGRVIASSSPGNVNFMLDMQLAGVMPTPEQGRTMGPLLMGRDLSDMARLQPGGQASPVLPILYTRSLPNGQTVHVVQLLNLDHLGAQFELTLETTSAYAALSTYAGVVLTGTDKLAPAPGHSLAGMAVFTQYLPRIESGRFLGAGLQGAQAVVAFRTLRKWPLVVLVEMPRSLLIDRLRRVALLAAALAGVALALLAGCTFLVFRSLTRHEALLHDIDKVNRLSAASNARNNAVLESALDGILTIDANDVIIAFNPAAERIFGYSASRAIGHRMTDLIVPPSHHSGHPEGLKRYLATGKNPLLNKRQEDQAMHADGHVFPVEITVVAVQSGDEQFFTATVRDIAEQKRAESEKASLLRIFKQLNKDLATEKRALDAHAIVSIVDLKGQITYANDKLLAISGFQRDELIGKKYWVLGENSLKDEEYQAMRACFDKQQVWHGETSHPRKDGSFYWAASTVVPVSDMAGQLNRIITVQTDISARREAELALALARHRELETGNRIQQTLLVSPPKQPHAELWMATFNQASRGIDGDFFDVLRIGPDAIDVVGGDVMGKGVPAALMGAATKLQFSRSLAELLIARGPGAPLPQPKDIVTAVNAAMAPHLQALEAFVTLVYLRIDLKTNTITWVGCGHEEPLLVNAGHVSRLLENQHPPMGIFLNEQHLQSQCAMQEGDAVFLCSDGASDAILRNGERIGRDRVNATVAHHIQAYRDPAMVLHAVRRDLLLDGVTITDDLTMVMLSRKIFQRRQTRIEVPVSLSALRQVRKFVEEHALAATLSEEQAGLLTVMAVEVVTNVVRHAEGLVPEAPITLVMEELRTSVSLKLMYLGDRYDPQEAQESNFATFPEGGFGMYIIQTGAENTDYRHYKGLNTVRIMTTKGD